MPRFLKNKKSYKLIPLEWVNPRQRADTSLVKTQNYVHCTNLFILSVLLHCLNYLKMDNTEQLKDCRETALCSGKQLSIYPEGLHRQLCNSKVTSFTPNVHPNQLNLQSASDGDLLQFLISEDTQT